MADTDTTQEVIEVPPPQPTNYGKPNILGTFALIPVFMLIFYFFVIKPQHDKENSRKKKIEQMKKGERVMTSGGLLGQVVDVKESFLVLKIAKDVKVEVSKESVHPVEESAK